MLNSVVSLFTQSVPSQPTSVLLGLGANDLYPNKCFSSGHHGVIQEGKIKGRELGKCVSVYILYLSLKL